MSYVRRVASTKFLTNDIHPFYPLEVLSLAATWAWTLLTLFSRFLPLAGRVVC
jgi:hypothetical protein